MGEFRKQKAAVKMHTLLDLHGNIPTFIRITGGKVHDINILDECYVMEGYVDFEGSLSARRSSSCEPRRTDGATRIPFHGLALVVLAPWMS